MHIKTKAATLWRLAFSITLLSIMVACDNPASIGGELVDKSEVTIDTILVDNLVPSTLDPYLGQLTRSASGHFEDDLFGTVDAFSFLKVPLTSVSDSLVMDDSTDIQLELQIFPNQIYGDTLGTSDYYIYRVTNSWRGATFRRSETISYNDAELIGEFSDADADSNNIILVDLEGSWRTDYINYANSFAEDRKDVYNASEYGLAIVPSSENQKINYFSLGNSDLLITQDSTEYDLSVFDWGYDLEQTDVDLGPDNIMLPSTYDQYYTFDLSEIADRFTSRNIVKAELIFTEDSLAMQNSLNPNEVRTSSYELGIRVGPVEDIAFEIGFGGLSLAGIRNNHKFVFNMTSAFNNYFYADAKVNELYLYLVDSQGLLSYSSLFTPNTEANTAPKVVIYAIESEN
jgi:hypothetical protein